MSNSPYSSSALKRSAIHFLTGKAISALLTLVILLWLVRLLATEEYGVYIFIMAGMELALVFTSLGLPWLATRYLPEFRLYASGKVLAHFVWQLLIRIILLLVVGALLLLVAIPWLLPLELAQYLDVAKLYLLVFFLEGLGRNIRDSMLGPLLQQGQARISLIGRSLILLLLLGIVSTYSVVHLHHVVLAELAASVLGTLLALHGLARYLHKHRELPGQDSWRSPTWPEMWRIARHMYLSQLMNQAYGPQVFVFLVHRYLGLEATALFGFLRSLYGQILRYLPAALLSSLIRPKLVVSFVDAGGGMAELSRNANLVGKLSLFALAPILIFAWLAGNELTSLLSGGKFTQADYYLAGLLLVLIPLSQRQLLETVAVTSDRSHLCVWGNFLGILALPLAYWLLDVGQGLWGIIIAMIVGQIMYNALLVTILVRTTEYRPDTIGLFKLVAAAFVGFALTQQFKIPIENWKDLFIMATLTCSIFLLISYFIKPFQTEERAKLNRLFNYKIFVW